MTLSRANRTDRPGQEPRVWVRNRSAELSWTVPDRVRDDARVWIVLEEQEAGNGSAVLQLDFRR